MSPPPVKVCFVANRLVVGGAERHAVTVANGLDPSHFLSTFVTLGSRGPLEALLDRNRLGDPFSLDVGRKLDLSSIRRLREHLDRHDIEVIVAANPYPTLYAFLARFGARRAPALITTFHSSALPDLKEKIQFPVYRGVFMACETLVYVSENQRMFWRSRMVRAKRDLTIHNGIDTAFFSATACPLGREATRREFGIGEADFLIGACAALRPEKRLADLIKALAVLRARGVPARVLLIGDGPERVALEEAARRLGVADQVGITGYQVDVRRYVLACDAMALTSQTETFSLSALESMALGRPMVMTNVGGASEQVVDGESGFLYGSGDVDALVAALSRLADRPTAARMGEAAARRVREHFRLEEMIARYSSLITSLATRGRVA